jgi:hypothetical protein
MRSEDVVRALDEQTSEIYVACLRDAELRITVPGLAASRSQTEIAAYIAALLKAFFTAQGQHIGQRRDVANTVNLQECLCLRILCLADLLDLSIVLLDLGGYLRDLQQHRTERLRESLWHNSQASLGETPCRGSGHTIAA